MKTIKQFLSESKNPKFAARWTTDPDHLKKLSKDDSRDVRYYVARNTATPHHVLDALSKDKDSYVRASVAYNTSTHPDTLHAMSKDEEEGVRYYALKNIKDRQK